MARTYLEAFAAVRKIAKVKVYSPNPANARLYAEEMSKKFGIEIEPVDPHQRQNSKRMISQ